MQHRKIVIIVLFSFLISANLYSQKFSAVLDYSYGYLIGGVSDGKFIKGIEAGDKIKINDEFKLYSLSGYLGIGKCENIITDQQPCNDLYYIGLKTDIKPKKAERAIAISGDWNACPKIPKIENTKNKTYETIISDILKSKGVKNPNVQLNQIIRTDLEGDGVEEVLISANSHFKSFFDKTKGDYYSILVLRKIINGKVENIVITAETKMADLAYVNKILAILDIDNDGVMEIITSMAYYEGDTTIIYKLKGNEAEVILSEGCGV
jgi:hypothetical protein